MVYTETLISVAIVLFSAIMVRLENLNRRISRLEGKMEILCDTMQRDREIREN